MAKVGYSEDFCYFWSDMQIQDDTTQMYKTAMKLFIMLKMSDSMSNLEEDANRFNFANQEAKMVEDQPFEVADLGEEEFGFDVGAAANMPDTIFKVEEFKHAMERGESDYIYHTFV